MASETTLYLIRHPQTVSNAEGITQGSMDPPLSELGLKQTEALVRVFHDVPLVAVYASSLVRAAEPARAIAADHDLEAAILPHLREICHGEWEGLSWAQIEERFPELSQQWLRSPQTVRLPGGETIAELQARAAGALEGLLHLHEGKTFIVVGHGGTNRALLVHWLGMELKDFWRFSQACGCVNHLTFTDGWMRIRHLNCTLHLGDSAG